MPVPGRLHRAARAGGQWALLAPAAFAVHQLRYMLAFGSQAGAELNRTGHSYLHSVAPWLVLGLAVAVGGVIRSIGRALAGQRTASRYTFSLAGLWLVCTAALVGIFVCQELLEGWLAVGHVAGLNGVFGYGGWWAIPISGCIGLVLAAWFHGARWVVREIVRRRADRAVARRRRATIRFGFPAPVLAAASDALADGWSQRGPPV